MRLGIGRQVAIWRALALGCFVLAFYFMLTSRSLEGTHKMASTVWVCGMFIMSQVWIAASELLRHLYERPGLPASFDDKR